MHFAGSSTQPKRTAALLLLLSAAVLHEASAQAITILPDTNDITLFEGQEFRRVCSVPGAVGDVSYQWHHNGAVIESGSGTNLQLRLTSVELGNQGEYFCMATLSDGSSTQLGPASGGTLTVLAVSDIEAPADQFIIRGSSSRLNCSYPGAIIFWYDSEGDFTSPFFASAALEDEDQYMCEVFLDSSGASVRVNIDLHIIEPVRITTLIPGNQNIEGRSPFSQSVEFSGRQSQDIVITWHRDGFPLPPDEFTVEFPSETAGRTGVAYPAIMRNHAGVYRVVIESQLGRDVLPTDITYAEISFQVTVEVPPSPPADFEASGVTSYNARLTWTLTNQTADEGAESLIITIFYTNGTLAVETVVPGDQTQTVVELVPGTQYIATLTAVNPDGMATTEPITIQTLSGAPLITGVNVTREAESFTITVSLAYTGGGNITNFDLSYRVLSSDVAFTPLGDFPADALSELIWVTEVTDVTNPDLLALEESLEFNVSVRNVHRFQSNGRTFLLSRPSVTPPSTSPTPTPSPTPLPLWLLVVVVVLVTALITVVVMTIIGCACYRCRRREDKHKYNINDGEHQLSADDDLVKRTDQDNLTKSVKNGILPVIIEDSADDTRPANEYMHQPTHHTRSPSNFSTGSSATSLSKPRVSPSTTASNSPANFIKGSRIKEEAEEDEYSRLRDDSLAETKIIVAQEDGSQTESVYQSYCNNQHKADSNYSQSECGESERETPLPLKQQFITHSGYSSNSSSHQSIPLKYLSPSPAGNPESLLSLPVSLGASSQGGYMAPPSSSSAVPVYQLVTQV